MKTLFQSIWLLFVLAALALRAAVPSVTPLGALSAQLHGPARVASDANGNLYVTDPSAGCVIVFDAFGQQRAVHDGFAGPLAIAIAGDGRIYLSEGQTGSVSVFDSQWNLLYQLGAGANEFQLPSHLAVDPLAPGTVYVSDSAANLVRIYTGATPVGQFGTNGTGAGQFSFPAGIAVRTNGEVFVVDQNNDRMEVFTNGPGGWEYSRKFPLGAGGMFGGPSGRSQALLLDNTGRAFVADSMQGYVKVFDVNSGALLGTVSDFGGAPGQLNLPLGMALDGFNRLCVASANNSRIELFGVDNFLHLSTQTVNGNLAAGNNLVFTVTIGGSNNPSLQWQKNGANLAGATNTTLTIAGASTGDSGNYSVILTTSSGVITSSVTPVTVLTAPNILSDPVDLKILAGTTAAFDVIATGSDLNFQWQFNGQDLAGATSAHLTLADAQVAQSGQYSVRVKNAVGSLVSAPATLTVVAAPLVMDLVSGAIQLDQSFLLTLNVDPGFTFDLQATTDLAQWQTVTNFAADGLFDFVDWDSTNYPNRYYRLRWQP